MTGRKRSTLLLVLVLGLVAGPLPAALAEELAAKPADPPKKASELKVTVKENKLFKFEKDVVTIKGQVEMVKGDVRLSAGDIVYDAKKKFAVIAGGARMVQDDLALSGEKFSAWFDEERYVIETKVSLSKKDATAEKKEKLALTCDRLEYRSGDKTMVATGNVTLKENERVATARKVEYRDKEAKVVLEGDVLIKEKDDKTIRGERFIIDTDQNVVEAEGPMEIEFKL
ncbi:MAG: LptA/OstA family protein [Chitinophagales bacterium]